MVVVNSWTVYDDPAMDHAWRCAAIAVYAAARRRGLHGSVTVIPSGGHQRLAGWTFAAVDKCAIHVELRLPLAILLAETEEDVRAVSEAVIDGYCATVMHIGRPERVRHDAPRALRIRD